MRFAAATIVLFSGLSSAMVPIVPPERASSHASFGSCPVDDPVARRAVTYYLTAASKAYHRQAAGLVSADSTKIRVLTAPTDTAVCGRFARTYPIMNLPYPTYWTYYRVGTRYVLVSLYVHDASGAPFITDASALIVLDGSYHILDTSMI
jgi:hypothetical protein